MPVDNRSRTLTSNTGFYYVCFKLSSLGWHVEPSGVSPRNRTLSARRGTARITVKVKAVNGRSAAGFGVGELDLRCDFVIVADVSERAEPPCFILSEADARQRMNSNVKDDRVSYWLEFKDYRLPDYEERWETLVVGAD